MAGSLDTVVSKVSEHFCNRHLRVGMELAAIGIVCLVGVGLAYGVLSNRLVIRD